MTTSKKAPFGQKTVLLIAIVAAVFAGTYYSDLVGPTGKSADAAREFHKQVAVSENGETLCFPEFSGSGGIHAIYTYAGGKRLDQEDRSSPNLVDVEVRKTEEPVLLALSGYDEPLLLNVPEGVSVGKTFHKAVWSDDNQSCILPDALKSLNAELTEKHKDRSIADLRANNDQFVFDRYFALRGIHNRGSFEDAVSWISDFRYANILHPVNGKKSFIISDEAAAEFAKRVDQARKEVAYLEKPANRPDAKTRDPEEEVREFTDPHTFMKEATRLGYIRDGKQDFEYYCRYKSALQRVNGQLGKHACQFHVRYKFEDAYTILGNLKFPPKSCFKRPVAIMIAPGIHKPHAKVCGTSNDAVVYLPLMEKPCLLRQSECEGIEEMRRRMARADKRVRERQKQAKKS